MPGTAVASWSGYKARAQAIFHGADPKVLVAFWLFGTLPCPALSPPLSSLLSPLSSRRAVADISCPGLINNVLYVIILSAALDLVGPLTPKSVVLLADVLPSFLTKLIAPYFIHRIPYTLRIIIFCLLSSSGMLLIALTPPPDASTMSIVVKLFGVVLASLSSGGGELSFLGLTHYYGHFSLAAWGSGTGGAGLAGAGLYVLLTTTLGFSVTNSLLASALLPIIMLVAFFIILPLGPLKAGKAKEYESIPGEDVDEEDAPSSSLLASDSNQAPPPTTKATFKENLHRAKKLFIPYMLPLLLVYISEYLINLAVTPVLLYPLEDSPFWNFRDFYPTYAFLYQIGVFISRSSTPFIRLSNIYLPSLLQVVNLVLLLSQALFFWIPSVWLIFIIIFWEGLLGGAVYVNCFAKILDEVREGDREFSLGATSVSDSGGICVAGFVGLLLEPALCGWNVGRGRRWCKTL